MISPWVHRRQQTDGCLDRRRFICLKYFSPASKAAGWKKFFWELCPEDLPQNWVGSGEECNLRDVCTVPEGGFVFPEHAMTSGRKCLLPGCRRNRHAHKGAAKSCAVLKELRTAQEICAAWGRGRDVLSKTCWKGLGLPLDPCQPKSAF